jgi:outer membrane PBP1 activator LpoA protein
MVPKRRMGRPRTGRLPPGLASQWRHHARHRARRQPVALAQQIADLFQLRQSEGRAKSLQSTVGSNVAAQPSRRQDIDFIFLAATPQQAQQIKPTLNFQYAGDVPVYATSTCTAPAAINQYNDMNGIRFCETPWLLDTSNSLRQQVVQQWPQAAGSLGRLYAMGVDAYSLAPRLGQLKALPDNRVEGLGQPEHERQPTRRAPAAMGRVRRRPGQAPAGHPALMPDGIACLRARMPRRHALEHLQGQGCAAGAELAMQRRRA